MIHGVYNIKPALFFGIVSNFPQILTQKYLNLLTIASFQILSTFSFISYPAIRHIPVTDAESFVKHSTQNSYVNRSESFTVKNSDR